MFSSLMPQRKEFFELLGALADRVVAAANAGLHLMNGLGVAGEDIDALTGEVAVNVASANKIRADLITLLHRSFTTPINRDQIHTLTIELDRVLGALHDVANAVGMYAIKDSTPESREMASLGADACMRLARAVNLLADKDRKPEIAELCKEVDTIESAADRVKRQAIAALFSGEAGIWMAMKMREFYALQEDVLDRCEEAAKTIEEILIENS